MSDFTEIETKHVTRAKYWFGIIAIYTVAIWTYPNEVTTIPTKQHSEALAYYPVTSLYFVLIILVPIGYYLFFKFHNNQFDTAYSDENEEPTKWGFEE